MRYYDARLEQRDTERGRTDWNGVARRSQYELEDDRMRGQTGLARKGRSCLTDKNG